MRLEVFRVYLLNIFEFPPKYPGIGGNSSRYTEQNTVLQNAFENIAHIKFSNMCFIFIHLT